MPSAPAAPRAPAPDRDASTFTPAEIQNLRERLSLTQAAFAQVIPCSRRAIQRWENGTTRPLPIAIERMRALAATLRTDPRSKRRTGRSASPHSGARVWPS